MPMNINAATRFYRTYIHNDAFNGICRDRGFTTGGLVSSKTWEIFAAILLETTRNPNNSPDLTSGWEVKSAAMGSSFEYQYHRNEGLTKIHDDMTCKHLFISYEQNYEATIIRRLDGNVLAGFFKGWLPMLREAYKNPLCQRFRKNVAYTFVANKGEVVLSL